jgi:enoyl-[acyl-carrier-protein] reductase (NADH)
MTKKYTELNFAKLAKPTKEFKTSEQMYAEGVTSFESAWGHKMDKASVKTKKEALDFLVSVGFAEDKKSAKKVLRTLVGEYHQGTHLGCFDFARQIRFDTYVNFRMQEVRRTPNEEPEYTLLYNDI